jgi:hypothetical protein
MIYFLLISDSFISSTTLCISLDGTYILTNFSADSRRTVVCIDTLALALVYFISLHTCSSLVI